MASRVALITSVALITEHQPALAGHSGWLSSPELTTTLKEARRPPIAKHSARPRVGNPVKEARTGRRPIWQAWGWHWGSRLFLCLLCNKHADPHVRSSAFLSAKSIPTHRPGSGFAYGNIHALFLVSSDVVATPTQGRTPHREVEGTLAARGHLRVAANPSAVAQCLVGPRLPMLPCLSVGLPTWMIAVSRSKCWISHGRLPR